MMRPFVGAIFGFVVIALLEADLINLAESGSKLALYAVLAFFAGFNERFAQDALTSSIRMPVSGSGPGGA